jgi:hypothetical protein
VVEMVMTPWKDSEGCYNCHDSEIERDGDENAKMMVMR